MARRGSRRSRRPVRPGAVVRWVLLGAAALVVVGVAWIGVRGLLAYDALTGAVPLVQDTRAAILAGDSTEALDDLEEIQSRAAEAADLTSDPVWRAGEVIPFAGANLAAFRQAAEVVDQVAREALPPLAELADGFEPATFVPRDGVVDVQPMIDARPLLGEASAAMGAASDAADRISTEFTIPPIGDAVDRLVGLVDDTAGLVTGVADAAEILPAMLGQDGRREYLLLVLNNAELRAAGGIPGALALLTADGGRLELGRIESAAAFGRRSEPLPLTDPERTLYSDNLGLYLQNATATPDFERTAELAHSRWSERYGAVDGVLSVDPVALSYILAATGPVDVGDGVVLDATTAAETLLSGSYERYPDPAAQDAFFARAAAAIFQRLTTGGPDPRVLLEGLVRAGEERRILVWSADAGEQEVIAGGSVAGPPLPPVDDRMPIGVYLHDSTESKMDWYLRAAIGIASVDCRNDDRPFYEVQVRLESTAPEDAGTALPRYVTGNAREAGMQLGDMRTGVIVTLPAGSLVYEARIDGQPTAYTLAEEDGRTVAIITVDLPPGASSRLSFHILGPDGAPLAAALQHTPMAFEVETSIDNAMPCPVLPTDAPPTQARAEARIPG